MNFDNQKFIRRFLKYLIYLLNRALPAGIKVIRFPVCMAVIFQTVKKILS